MEKPSLFTRLKEQYFTKKYKKRKFATMWQIHNRGDHLEFVVRHRYYSDMNGVTCGRIYENDPDVLHFYPVWSKRVTNVQADWRFLSYVLNPPKFYQYYIRPLRSRKKVGVRLDFPHNQRKEFGIGWFKIKGLEARAAEVEGPPVGIRVANPERRKWVNKRLKVLREALVIRANLGAFGSIGERANPQRRRPNFLNATGYMWLLTVDPCPFEELEALAYHIRRTSGALAYYLNRTMWTNSATKVKAPTWAELIDNWMSQNRHRFHDAAGTHSVLDT